MLYLLPAVSGRRFLGAFGFLFFMLCRVCDPTAGLELSQELWQEKGETGLESQLSFAAASVRSWAEVSRAFCERCAWHICTEFLLRV